MTVNRHLATNDVIPLGRCTSSGLRPICFTVMKKSFHNSTESFILLLAHNPNCVVWCVTKFDNKGNKNNHNRQRKRISQKWMHHTVIMHVSPFHIDKKAKKRRSVSSLITICWWQCTPHNYERVKSKWNGTLFFDICFMYISILVHAFTLFKYLHVETLFHIPITVSLVDMFGYINYTVSLLSEELYSAKYSF